MTRPRGLLLGFVDQGLSSASNVLVMFAVARTSSVVEFGAVALVLMFVTTALAVTRGTFGTPLLLSGSRPPAERARELGGAQTGAIAIGVMVALAVLVAGTLQAALLPAAVLAIATPVVLAQDVHRFAALARQDQFGAVLWDGIWALGVLALLVLTWVDQSLLSGVQVLTCWAMLASASLAGLMARSGALPVLFGWVAWWRESHGHRIRFGVEGAIGALSSLLVVSGAAVLIGEAAAAALRGAGTIMGPLSVLMSAMPLAILPEAVRTAQSPHRTWGILRKVAASMSVVALAVGALGLLLPESWGALLLGASWRVVAPLLPITGLEYAGLAWISILYTSQKARGLSEQLLRTRLAHAFTSLLLATSAAFVWRSAIAVAVALASTAVLVAILFVLVLRPGRRRY